MRSYVIIIAVMTAARSAVAIELLELGYKIDPKKCTKELVQGISSVMAFKKSRDVNYTRIGDRLDISGGDISRFLAFPIDYCHLLAGHRSMNIRSHPSEATHASKCNGSMVIIGICVGLKDITYLGMGCHASVDSDIKDLATNKEWNRVCGDGDSTGKKADSGHCDKIPVSTPVCAVIGVMALVVTFLSGFFCYKKFFTAKPDPVESVTPVSTDQTNKAAEQPTPVPIPAPPKEEPKKTVTPAATDEQKTLDQEETDLQSYKSDLKGPTSETSKTLV